MRLETEDHTVFPVEFKVILCYALKALKHCNNNKKTAKSSVPI